MCLCSCACLCVSVMLGAGMCRCSGPLRSRRGQKKKKKKQPDREASLIKLPPGRFFEKGDSPDLAPCLVGPRVTSKSFDLAGHPLLSQLRLFACVLPLGVSLFEEKWLEQQLQKENYS